jgi:preprotein translocase subunit SecG
MTDYLNVAQILISIFLIIVVLMQVKGAGLGGIFGQQASVFRTRRGVEKTLFQLTIILAAVFLVMSIVSVRVA